MIKAKMICLLSTLNFHHVTSSPHFPQSNGLVENAVKQAKNLLDKCKKDGSDPLLGLLNLRNVPRDQVLGSPVQCLMSRRTRCLLPVAKKLLAPRALNNKHVSSHLKSKRMQQKAFYDRGAKPLPPLNPQQVVRLQTNKGYDKVGIVKQPTADPRSYIVNVGEREYQEIADISWLFQNVLLLLLEKPMGMFLLFLQQPARSPLLSPLLSLHL